MSEKNKYFGLCSNCRNASICTFPRDPDKPAFYCEEFEIETTISSISYQHKPLFTTVSLVKKEKDSSKFYGLCSDCENRKSCTFPKPEGGIWHCEEYQ